MECVSRRAPSGLAGFGSSHAFGLVACVALVVTACSGSSTRAPTTVGTSISGTVTGASGVTIEVTGASTTATTTDASGRFTVGGLANGPHTVRPIKAGRSFVPPQREIVLAGVDVSGLDFDATPAFSVSGTVTGASGVILELTTPGFVTTTATDGAGRYTFTEISDGTYTVAASRPGHAVTPLFRTVTVSGADVAVVGFTATALTLLDPLTAGYIDGQHWQTPEYVRTISRGAAQLSQRARAMQLSADQGIGYTNGLTVATSPGTRITTLGADIVVPTQGDANSSQLAFAGIRLVYQPSPDRGLAFPGASGNKLVAALEFYQPGPLLRVRRRFGHCTDAACTTLSGVGITSRGDWGVGDGVDAGVYADSDTSYTCTISLNEATGVFTWTVKGGSFGAGVSGTADVSGWAANSGLNLASDTDGFLSAQLVVGNTSGDLGNASGAITADFDEVMVGVNGAAATIYDNFSTLGSSTESGFDPTKWTDGPNGSVLASADGVHLVGATSAIPSQTVTQSTALTASYPSTFSAWQADVTITEEARLPSGASSVQLAGTYLNDGTAGASNDGTGDILARVTLETSGAGVHVLRCTEPTCQWVSSLAQGSLTPAPGHPMGIGTTHTVFTQWDPLTRAFAFRLDDGQPLRIVLSTVTSPVAARVPTRYVRANTSAPPTAAAGAQSFIDVAVRDVRSAP